VSLNYTVKRTLYNFSMQVRRITWRRQYLSRSCKVPESTTELTSGFPIGCTNWSLRDQDPTAPPLLLALIYKLTNQDQDGQPRQGWRNRHVGLLCSFEVTIRFRADHQSRDVETTCVSFRSAARLLPNQTPGLTVCISVPDPPPYGMQKSGLNRD
jgi:hypothetical protein